MNDINTAGDGMSINGDLGRQTSNRGSSHAQTRTQQQGTRRDSAASVCDACDGTGWTHHATKGLTRCTGIGLPHA